MTKKPNCSLIILAYNEERNIARCLDAVSRLNMMPDEVLVIDNNSTDKTAKIAASYPFVRVIREQKQGMIPARDRGFKEARGDILMRIDADTVVPPEWSSVVIDALGEKNTDCVTGPSIAEWPRFPGSERATLWLSRAYFIWGHAMFGTLMAWGANMALKRSAWEAIKDKTCKDGSIVHEDQDISLWLAKLGFNVRFDSKMYVTSDWKSLEYIPTIISYAKKRYTTSRWHWDHDGFTAPWWTLFYRFLILLLLAPIYIIYGLFFITCTLLMLFSPKKNS